MLCHYNSILLFIKMETQQICDNQGEMTKNSQLNLLIQQFGREVTLVLAMRDQRW